MFRKQTLEKYSLLILVVLFAFSVVIRLPGLNRPLSKHHEVNAALVLINAEEWNRHSAAFYHFVPVNNYHLPGDQVTKEVINNGYLVNVSFGSLWYIMPYGFFKVLQVRPSAFWLQVFNVLLHFICVLLIYHVALLLIEDRRTALLTAVFYTYCPVSLWFHGNAYVHEVAVLPFVFASCLVFLKWLQGKRNGLPVLLFVLIVAGINCDWLMCFVAGAMFFVNARFYYKYRQRQYLYNMLAIACAVLLAITIIVVQFSSFMGFKNYANSLFSRYVLRGITGTVQAAGLATNAGLFTYYLVGYGLLLPLTAGVLLYRKAIPNKLLRNFIIVAAVTCALHHILFWGFSNIHDYAVLKAALVLSLLSTVVVMKISPAYRISIVLLVLVGNVTVYYMINRPGNFAANGQPYTYFKILGEKIGSIAQPEEYVFVDTPEMSLLLTYYSKRYYQTVSGQAEAKALLSKLPGKQAVYIHTDYFRFVSATRIIKNPG